MGWWSGVSYSVFFITVSSGEEYNTSDAMNKLIVITVLVALLALSADSFRVPRQAEEDQGTLTKVTDKLRVLYDSTVNTATEYLDNIRGLNLEEKAKNLFIDTTKAVSTYTSIMQDQLYHILYNKQ